MLNTGIIILYSLTCLGAPQMALYTAYADLLEAGTLLETRPNNPKQGPFMANQDMRLRMAIGERESFQIWLQGGDEAADSLRIDVRSTDSHAPEVALYEVGGIAVGENPRGMQPRALQAGYTPDFLLPAGEISLEAEEERLFWGVFRTDAQSRPGRYTYQVEVHEGDKRLRAQRLVLEVLDFVLPAGSPMPILGDLHQPVLQDFLGLASFAPEDWQPLYEFLLRYGITPGVADYRLLDADLPGDISALTAHFEAMLAVGAPAVLEVGGVQGSLMSSVFPHGSDNTEPTTAYLNALKTWRDARDTETPAFLLRLPPIPLTQTAWPQRYPLYKYCFEQASAFRPVTGGAIHPFFQQVMRHWSAPFSVYEPELMERLRSGASLRNVRHYPAYRWIAETPAAPGALDNAYYDNAFDGSPFTIWDSGYRPTPQDPLTLTFVFDGLVRSESIHILWAGDNHATDMDVYTSADGANFTPATVRWNHETAVALQERSRSQGIFRYPNNFSAIQLVLKNTLLEEDLRFALIAFQQEDQAEADGLAPPISPWLEVDYHRFPVLAPGGRGIEPRLIPWVAWAHRYAGIFLGYLNYWPADWPVITDSSLNLPRAPGPWQQFLIYPGEQTVLPSVRLERLRDGIEDIAYLQALEDAVNRELLDPEATQELLARPTFPIVPAASDYEAFSDWIESRSNAAADLLDGIQYRP